MDDSIHPASGWLFAIALGGSAAACYVLFRKLVAGRPLLAKRPRRPAPWNAWAAAFALGPTLISWTAGLLPISESPPLEETAAAAAWSTVGVTAGPLSAPTAVGLAEAVAAAAEAERAATFVTQAWTGALLYLFITAAIYLVVANFCHADRSDLGLPTGWSDAGRDAAIGAFGFLASLAPVVVLNHLLESLVQPQTHHPYIENVLANPSWAMMVVVAVAALIVAPLFEETTFRLLLQGWLERAEHQVTVANYDAWSTPEPPDAVGIGGLPRGWAPILVSSLLFGLAHWGHGVAPIPLVLLGLALGYVYYRTHRILPCIVLHMLFNAHTMLHMAIQTQT